MLPEYIVMKVFLCGDLFYGYTICKDKLESLGKYDFETAVVSERKPRGANLNFAYETHVWRLKKEFKPFY